MTGHGGKRPGAGRKPRPPRAETAIISAQVTGEIAEQARQLGQGNISEGVRAMSQIFRNWAIEQVAGILVGAAGYDGDLADAALRAQIINEGAGWTLDANNPDDPQGIIRYQGVCLAPHDWDTAVALAAEWQASDLGVA